MIEQIGSVPSCAGLLHMSQYRFSETDARSPPCILVKMNEIESFLNRHSLQSLKHNCPLDKISSELRAWDCELAATARAVTCRDAEQAAHAASIIKVIARFAKLSIEPVQLYRSYLATFHFCSTLLYS